MSTQAVDFFDATSIDPGCRGFSGVVSDGRALYFAPLHNGEFHGKVLRHETSQNFGDRGAWSFFDCSQIDPDALGFTDSLFDGRYVYLVPFFNGEHHGRIVRFDTTGDFNDAQSWQGINIKDFNEGACGFVSGCFDGRYIYLAPYQLDLATTNGIITRYDIANDFNAPEAWSFFDASAFHPDCRGFHSAVSDGTGRVWEKNIMVDYLFTTAVSRLRLQRLGRVLI